jgi:hypothetical protein
MNQKRRSSANFELQFGWRLYILLFISAFSIIVLRRPDAILNPQFWAEDGALWYANAYNDGIRSVLIPQNGYLQTISRIVAAIAQFLPFEWAPLIFNGVAIFIQILPVIFLLSSRFSALIPNRYNRIFFSILYLALPNSWEIHANLTNAQWHLALLAFMVIVAKPDTRPVWRCFDTGVVLLSGLSGPFSILLVPIAAIRIWLDRERWLIVLFLLVSASALVQTLCLLLAWQTRSQMFLGATPELLVRILSGQVFLGALIGQGGYSWLVSSSEWRFIPALFIALIGLTVMIYALLKGPVELRFFIIFALLTFSTALISPQASATNPQWQVLTLPGVGGRYWFIPMLAFISVLIWMLRKSSSPKLRLLAMMALAVMLIGIIMDWQQPPYVDLNFKEHAHRFEGSPIGTEIVIPINPPGWYMSLTKN